MSPRHVKCEMHQEEVACHHDQPAHFRSQQSFFLWLAESPSIELEHVKDISLRITDIDMTALIKPTPSPSSPEPRIWDMYEKELEKICDGFGRLPNLTHVTILEPTALHSHLFRDLYTRVLQRLPVCLPAGCSLCVPLVQPLDAWDERHAKTSIEKDYVRSDSTRPDTPPTTPRSNAEVMIKDEPT
ncbi:hypothetical protein BDV97DRAFT_400076 [Delphinella strobiligena]|nr:hypothetical protein BDV97DRAFT_400076 [Delphinella strobiligena]